MFPARFEYARPSALQEALDVLAEQGEQAKVLAGGQSLIPLMKLRFASPGMLVDINDCGLRGIDEAGGTMTIGALTRHNELAASTLLENRLPLMSSAAPQIADPLVRNLGTIGGSLAHADPGGDWASVMLALNAEVVARSSSGERTVPIGDLMVSTFTTSLEPNEILTEVRVPVPQGAVGGAYMKLERKVGDFATVGVAVHLEMSNGNIGRAGIGLTAVGPSNIKATDAESALAGADPSDDAFAEAGRLAAAACDPTTDVRGTAEYKRAIVETYVVRGLKKALDMARAS
jgi:carbon-monoxide dehydrogenase medium subunit